MRYLKLKSSDDQFFLVNVEVLKCCQILYDQLEKLDDDSLEKETVQIEHANAAIITKIIEWATFHKDDPEPETSSSEDEDRKMKEISCWDMDFLNIDVKTLFELMLAANFLGIKGLINVTCKKIINMMDGKDATEFLSVF